MADDIKLRVNGKPSVREWRKRRSTGESMELPSGLVVQVRRVSLLDLVKQGRVPQSLLSMADQVMTASQITLDKINEGLAVVDLVVKACVIAPQVVDGEVDADDEERISIDELGAEDKLALFNWASPQTVAELRPFSPIETKS